MRYLKNLINKVEKLIAIDEIHPDLRKDIRSAELMIFQKGDKSGEIVDDGEFDDNLDLPFDNVYIEMNKGYITYHDDERFNILSILIKEFFPKCYSFVLNTKYDIVLLPPIFIDPSDKEKHLTFLPTADGKDFIDDRIRSSCIAMAKIVAELLGRMKKSRIGKEKVHILHKTRIDSKKQFYKFSNIHYIYGKNKELPKSGIKGNKIDWTHSWLVRGHWRKVDGIGKDRNGDYTIEGMTWVNPHKKGEGVLVKKIHFVKN